MNRTDVIAYLRGLSIQEVRDILRDIEDVWGSSIIVHEPCPDCHRIVYGPHACPGPAQTETEQYEFEVVLTGISSTIQGLFWKSANRRSMATRRHPFDRSRSRSSSASEHVRSALIKARSDARRRSSVSGLGLSASAVPMGRRTTPPDPQPYIYAPFSSQSMSKATWNPVAKAIRSALERKCTK